MTHEVAYVCRLDTAVVFIDTEMKFKEKRLLQIMGAHLQASQHTIGPESIERYIETLGKRVHVIQPKTGPCLPICFELNRGPCTHF